jgi:hypothetical protein
LVFFFFFFGPYFFGRKIENRVYDSKFRLLVVHEITRLQALDNVIVGNNSLISGCRSGFPWR